MWVDCPRCGKEKAAWEDSINSSFCGECEEKYQKSLIEEPEEKIEEKIPQRTLECFVDIYERAEEADEAIQMFWNELDVVCNNDIMEQLEIVLDSIGYINRIATDAVGGIGKMMLLRDKIHEEGV